MSDPIAHDFGECRSCGAPIRWVIMAASGKKNPLNALPNDTGNVFFNEKGEGVTVSKKNVPPEGATFYLSHFVTCPNRREHRKPA